MEWKLKSYEELSKEELYRIIKLRIDVFIVEQNCPYHELDHLDEQAHHLFLSKEGEIAAYCRLFPSGTAYPAASIGRVIVRKEDRGKGYAQTLLDKALRFLEGEWGETKVKISAQNHLRSFYGSFGFNAISDVYMEDGIPHVEMIRTAETV
ncbi:GNAT family N-acetyltransferase [Bacillus haynesii]|uniref:GNAT family N-acetyltransferase n=1 Tax=Bacillus haynesii TaxID=1925021 RepID=A0ABX3I294_9BACI|nr:GNAT family N-acetyltransferase [Bacillus haynesii]MCI4126772.1 GNAT family N-acetyltransferase [Bacillus haynesii]OMI26851.1 GNAT family N-acetyltransferase [Bacillus haynesii]